MAFPTIRVEAAFTVGGAYGTAMVLDSGLLNTNTLSAEVWTDITAYALSFNSRRGASRGEGPVLRYEAGTISVLLDNSDRRFDPTNLSGPYVSAGVSLVAPMRAVRILAEWGGASYPIFSGYADNWDISYEGPSVSKCTLTATDATKVLSNFDRVALGSPVGAGELSGARVHRVLDSVSWPVGQRDIDPGQSTLQGTTMDRSGWEELLLVQDTEIGSLFVDGRGYVVFQDRGARMSKGSSLTVQGAFGDGAGELPYADHTIATDDDGLANLVRIARVGGTQQIAQDTTSQQQYLVKTYDRTDLLMETDEAAADYASFVLYQAKDPETRFPEMSVAGHDDDLLFNQMLSREIGDLITLTRRPPGGGVVTRRCFIVGISHEVDGPNSWKTTWALQSATKWSFMVLNDATLGTLDNNAIAF